MGESAKGSPTGSRLRYGFRHDSRRVVHTARLGQIPPRSHLTATAVASSSKLLSPPCRRTAANSADTASSVGGSAATDPATPWVPNWSDERAARAAIPPGREG